MISAYRSVPARRIFWVVLAIGPFEDRG